MYMLEYLKTTNAASTAHARRYAHVEIWEIWHGPIFLQACLQLALRRCLAINNSNIYTHIKIKSRSQPAFIIIASFLYDFFFSSHLLRGERVFCRPRPF